MRAFCGAAGWAPPCARVWQGTVRSSGRWSTLNDQAIPALIALDIEGLYTGVTHILQRHRLDRPRERAADGSGAAAADRGGAASEGGRGACRFNREAVLDWERRV